MRTDTIVGLPRIAACLGVSPRTAQRYFKAGKLPGAYKLNGPTSPLRISAKQLERILRGRRR